jgi:hypothetical protein
VPGLVRLEDFLTGRSITALEVYPESPPAQYMCGQCDPRTGAIVIWLAR